MKEELKVVDEVELTKIKGGSPLMDITVPDRNILDVVKGWIHKKNS